MEMEGRLLLLNTVGFFFCFLFFLALYEGYYAEESRDKP